MKVKKFQKEHDKNAMVEIYTKPSKKTPIRTTIGNIPSKYLDRKIEMSGWEDNGKGDGGIFTLTLKKKKKKNTAGADEVLDALSDMKKTLKTLASPIVNAFEEELGEAKREEIEEKREARKRETPSDRDRNSRRENFTSGRKDNRGRSNYATEKKDYAAKRENGSASQEQKKPQRSNRYREKLKTDLKESLDEEKKEVREEDKQELEKELLQPINDEKEDKGKE